MQEIIIHTTDEIVISLLESGDQASITTLQDEVVVQADHVYLGGEQATAPTFELPLTNVASLSITAYDHGLTRIRGIALERADGHRLAVGYQVHPDLTVDLHLFRPITGKLLIF